MEKSILSELRKELHELRQTQNDFMALNDLIARMEDHYSMLLTQQHSHSKDHHQLVDSFDKTTLKSRDQLLVFRRRLQETIFQIQKAGQQNDRLNKILCEKMQALSEVEAMRHQANATIANQQAENRHLSQNIQLLQQDLNSLHAETDKISKGQENLLANMLQLQGSGSQSQANRNRLEESLQQAKLDQHQLSQILNGTKEQCRQIQLQIKQAAERILQTNQSIDSIHHFVDKQEHDQHQLQSQLQAQADRQQALLKKLNQLNSNIDQKQSRIAKLQMQEQQLRRKANELQEQKEFLQEKLLGGTAVLQQFKIVLQQLNIISVS